MWDFLLWGAIVFFWGGGIFKKGDFYMRLGGGGGVDNKRHLTFRSGPALRRLLLTKEHWVPICSSTSYQYKGCVRSCTSKLKEKNKVYDVL